MRLRMKISVSGTFHGNPEGVRVGDIVEVDDQNAARYISLGYAEKADQRGEEHAIASSIREERAVIERSVEKPVYGDIHPPEAQAAKRRPGRPRKVTN